MRPNWPKLACPEDTLAIFNLSLSLSLSLSQSLSVCLSVSLSLSLWAWVGACVCVCMRTRVFACTHAHVRWSHMWFLLESLSRVFVVPTQCMYVSILKRILNELVHEHKWRTNTLTCLLIYEIYQSDRLLCRPFAEISGFTWYFILIGTALIRLCKALTYKLYKYPLRKHAYSNILKFLPPKI